MEENFWPKLEPIAVKTPFSVLKEQGEKLQEITNGILLYEIKKRKEINLILEDSIINEFYIVAPLLDNIKYLLFSITYNSIEIFPINFTNTASLASEYVDINDWDTFNDALKNILGHINTKKILENLLAQSQEASNT